MSKVTSEACVKFLTGIYADNPYLGKMSNWKRLAKRKDDDGNDIRVFESRSDERVVDVVATDDEILSYEEHPMEEKKGMFLGGGSVIEKTVMRTEERGSVKELCRKFIRGLVKSSRDIDDIEMDAVIQGVISIAGLPKIMVPVVCPECANVVSRKDDEEHGVMVKCTSCDWENEYDDEEYIDFENFEVIELTDSKIKVVCAGIS